MLQFEYGSEKLTFNSSYSPRIHNKPTFSQTIVLQNLYINPQNSAKSADGSHLANVSDKEMQVNRR